MSKSRKRKKARKIVVDDIEYYWIVNRHNCDGDGGSIFNIWKDKKTIYKKLIHYPTVITPKNVRETILKIKENNEE